VVKAASPYELILEGQGRIWVGDAQAEAEGGTVVWVPSGYIHRILNTGTQGMVLLVGIAPTQADSLKKPYVERTFSKPHVDNSAARDYNVTTFKKEQIT
jgi:oxalate decarboxylase/phosphoglucose isomerase-like protein (cupin superfamily)